MIKYSYFFIFIISAQGFAKGFEELQFTPPSIEILKEYYGPNPLKQNPINETQKDLIRSELEKNNYQKPTYTADGGWIGSGGDSVVCFNSEADAQKAIDSSGRIKNYKKITVAYSLDFYEAQDKLTFIEPYYQESAIDFLKRYIKDYLKPVLPLLSEQLEWSLWNLNPTAWRATKSLPEVKDSGNVSAYIPSHCRIVQTIIRYAQHTPGQMPRVFIDVDQNILNSYHEGLLTGSLSMAMQLLHEAFYTMGVEIGQANSEAIRKLVALLLSEELMDVLQKADWHNVGAAHQLSLYIEKLGLSKFNTLFDEVLRNKFPNPTLGTKISRKINYSDYYMKMLEIYRPYISALEKAREDFEYYDEKRIVLEIASKSLNFLIKKNNIEYAFLYMSDFLYKQIPAAFPNPQNFIILDYDDKKDLEQVCRRLQYDFEGKTNLPLYGDNESKEHKKVLNMALEYCKIAK